MRSLLAATHALVMLAAPTALSAADWGGHFTTLDANKDGDIGPSAPVLRHG